MDNFKTPPLKHQLDNLNIRRGREAFADLSDMGTGKTWVAIVEAAMLWGEGKLDAVLVFAPKGVHSNWVLSQIPLHMPIWCSHIAREWYAGANKRDAARIEEVFQVPEKRTLRILAMNWDALTSESGRAYAKRFATTCSRLMVIGDESQRFKNPKAETTKALFKLKPHTSYRRIMSGSAILQGPFDLFSQFSWLDETILQTTSYFAFKAEYAEMLQPGNRLLEHIVKNRTRMSEETRNALRGAISKLGALLDSNGRKELKEVYDEMSCAWEDGDYEVVLAKCQALRSMFIPSQRPEAISARQSVTIIELIVGEHLRKASRAATNPRRLPQIVAKLNGVPKYRNLDKLKTLITPHMFRVLKSECLDLPQKIYTQTWFHMTPRQQEAYDKMKQEARMILMDGTEAPVAKLAALMKLSQILSGFIIEPITKRIIKVIGDELNPKLDLLKDRLDCAIDGGEAVIVWARFREEIAQAKALCEANGWRSCEYHGGTKDDDRPRLVAEFERGEHDVFIGQQHAGGTGITLVRAQRVIYYSNSFSLEDRVQSEDRAHRIGQTRSVVYEDLLCPGTVDVAIARALRSKKEIAALISGDIEKLLEPDNAISD